MIFIKKSLITNYLMGFYENSIIIDTYAQACV